MSEEKIAVLGLGFSGLYAAKAAKDAGCEVTVYSYCKNFNLLSDFWLSWIPEDVAENILPVPIKLIPIGKESKYLKLKWGRVPTRAESFKSDFPNEEKTVMGYEPYRVYAAMYPEKVEYRFEMFSSEEVNALTIIYDHVFQTLPSEDSYNAQNPLLPYILGIIQDDKDVDFENDKVWYNGSDLGYVAIRSNLWGNSYFKFPMNLPLSEIARVMPDNFLNRMEFLNRIELNQFTRIYQPPASTPDNLHFIGKWAEWNPYRRFDQIYEIVKGILNE